LNISPFETPFLSRLGVSRAYATNHEWLTDVMNATASTGDAVDEGASAANAALQDKTREQNYTQISDRVFTISGTEEAVSHYGLDSQYAYQLEKAMKELKIKMERALLGSSGTTAGGSGYPRQMRGAFKFGVSGGGATASGNAGASALTESTYNALIEDVFDNGGQPDTTYVNGFMKRRISAFQSNNTRNIEMRNKKLTGVVSVYESDFGQQEIVLDRWCLGLNNGEKGAGLVVDSGKLFIAYLRKPFTNPLAVDGDRKSVQLLVEYTLENRAPTLMGTFSAFATA
jgi:hypothetical protein